MTPREVIEYAGEDVLEDEIADLRAERAKPIPMVLICPRCGTQHVDAPEPERGWTNPPHKSHLCHHCDTIWRPADVPTNGVAAINTRGESDSWPPVRSAI